MGFGEGDHITNRFFSEHEHQYPIQAKGDTAMGIRVTESNKLDDAIQKALEYNGPSLVEIISDPDLI